VSWNGHVSHIALQLDRLATLEIRPRRDQGVVAKLHDAARARQGKPLTLAAAELLHGAVGGGDTVLLTTGAGHHDYLPHGETDGPPGIVALATVLAIGMRAVPVLVTEAEYADNLTQTALAGGLGVRSYDAAHRTPFTCTVVSFPSDDTAERVAAEWLERFAPAALVSSEKIGPNPSGVAHYASGLATTDERARVEHLFDLAAERGIPTIGIGDNGNEIGFGAIADAVREHKQWGRVCQCPCGGGLATRVATDALVVGSTSNWAAYGVAACLAAMIGRPELIRDRSAEHRVLEWCAMAGAADGSTGRAGPYVDGTPPEVSASLQQLMRSVVEICSSEPYQRPF
jgi:D-glutamate cyclase